jgi:hypothetical protein
MKRHPIFPALALVAALGTAAFAGWGSGPSTEVSDDVAARATGGQCGYWISGTCGIGGLYGCSGKSGLIASQTQSPIYASGKFLLACGGLCGTITESPPPCGNVTAPPAP